MKDYNQRDFCCG